MIRALQTFWNLHRISILLVGLSLVFYWVFGYDLGREDSVKLITLFAALFFFSFKLIQFEKWNLRFMVTSGLLFRAVLLFALPNLSQDFYRFIWDGNLILEGLNPYLLTPDQWMAQGGLSFDTAAELHKGMGSLSRENYSNYPPANQYFFALSAYLGGKTIMGTIISMRVMIILADLGILYFGRRILKKINRAPNLIFWYFLNPLVIIELTGNLHSEGVMLFFFVLAMFLVITNKWYLALFPYAFSIGIKLIPLLFLPLLLPLLGWKKATGFYLGIGLLIATLLYPLYFPEFGSHYGQTLRLWFSNFEFNASLYNLAEWIAVNQGAKPWEFIKQYGAIVPGLTALITLGVCAHPIIKLPKYWFGGALLALCSYYFLSTTVHPWYVIFPLLLSTFTNFRFVYLWSATVILSYVAYAGSEVQERPWILFIEYATVYGFLIYEIIRNKRNLSVIVKNQVRIPTD
ncbi:mannosyltransferase [Robiginitalea aurantiaca]|uniref:Mannosyltransferase n=1 Tax=Robiginitalea aurantiaca TaxID=3056915 RepID=A0ABT7WET8_9FLAO|nr:mannosyltransferase [Robiginitalea aurantiaca]MDM9631441.1 mannosyltransferase [Robiginitalea aurantiaca]